MVGMDRHRYQFTVWRMMWWTLKVACVLGLWRSGLLIPVGVGLSVICLTASLACIPIYAFHGRRDGNRPVG